MPHPYPDGDVFRPERWFTIAPTAFEFPVFSGGPHSCPGYWFGSTAVKVALVAILTHYRLSLAPNARIDLPRPADHAPAATCACASAPSGRRVHGYAHQRQDRDLVTLP